MHLFVYGTLRRAIAHPMHGTLCAVASPVGEARVRGRLYLIEHYPGLVLDPTGGWVTGELYSLRDPSVLDQLDAYEGASPCDPEPHEYRRRWQRVERHDADPVSAWLYEYRWPTDGRALIRSGDFLQCEP